MSWESIGSTDTGQVPGDESWIEFCQGLSIQYIRFVCGEPPPGVELGTFSQDHELGSYPCIGVWTEFVDDEGYAVRCEDALDKLNEAIEWETLKEHWEDSLDSDEIEEDHENGEDRVVEDSDESPVEQEEKPFDENMYDLMYSTISKEFSLIEGNTIEERFEKFLSKIYERYTPEQLVGIEPYVKRFIAENTPPRRTINNSDVEKTFVFDIQEEIDRFFINSSSKHLSEPRFVVLAGGVCSGKTYIRKEKFSDDFVVLDASEIFLNLSRGEYFDFGEVFDEPLNLIGVEVAKRAIQERRNIVTETVGASAGDNREIIDAIVSVGYKGELVPVFCDIDLAMERNLNRGDDSISAYYTEPYHLRWIKEATDSLKQ